MRYEGLENRVAIVTGAGSGIGRETAARLLEEGAFVVAADLDPSGAPEGCERIAVDVADERRVALLVGSTLRLRGRIDILINNAGIGSVTDVVACTVDEWERVFAVNVRAVFLASRQAIPCMLDQGGGVIVNTASVAGLVGLTDRAAYCASKGAVIALTRQIAVQYATRGIRCNCVCPGTIDSPWVGRLLEQAPDPVQARQGLAARQLMGRLGTPKEVAEAICFLASDAAAFITGSALIVDGGLTAA